VRAIGGVAQKAPSRAGVVRVPATRRAVRQARKSSPPGTSSRSARIVSLTGVAAGLPPLAQRLRDGFGDEGVALPGGDVERVQIGVGAGVRRLPVLDQPAGRDVERALARRNDSRLRSVAHGRIAYDHVSVSACPF
jgi:hypothetical protein